MASAEAITVPASTLPGFMKESIYGEEMPFHIPASDFSLNKLRFALGDHHRRGLWGECAGHGGV
jgi:hypothetical protein